ncbi:hemolysin type calcium-binding protein [Rhodobacter sp. JA431]|uniref:calcium-binding protein n=1 Tax=Rhodobacter sp. JA431 TaxID=570013 RepID=UPI000BCA73EC|nr:calcium-binding protein [Rhodobacter sp. JA431]SOB91528.1 hemolysin type calcium-binding protein [Rhodobacter sp. JA431]
MFDITQPYHGDPSLPSPEVISLPDATEQLRFTDASGTFLGQILIETSGSTTLYNFYDADLTLLGSVSEKVVGDTTRIEVYDAAGSLLSRERIIDRSDYTLHEHWDGTGAFTGAEKYIHTAKTTGVQIYDVDWNLVSAHLEVTEPGRTQVADYGPGWSVIYRETTTTSGNVTTTVIEENGAGNITGGTRVTEAGDFTLTEYFGAGWVVTGYEKAIHTATTTGIQVYDGQDNLLSAHLEINEPGRTQVADYGAGWSVIYRETTTISGNVTTTVIEENGAGNITGGTRVTEADDFTLTENFGAGWIVTGYEKAIHTATMTGIQVYDGQDNLLSAHLEINEPGRTQVADYGPGWSVIYRETTTISGNVTTTVIEENGAGNITGGTRVTEADDFTLTEHFGAGWVVTGYEKAIHTYGTTGLQIYDAQDNLISASMEIYEPGRMQFATYGPDWFVIYRETTTTSGNVTTTVIEENGAGNITGGMRETEADDFTLIEFFGPGWVVTGYEKSIHTETTTGYQIYDAQDNLIEARLDITEPGRTQVAQYGPDWSVIYRETTTTSGNVTTTVIEENGAGNITGGTRVTLASGFTLVETFGAAWVLLGYEKQVHTDTKTGVQIYDAQDQLVSAHLVIEDGGRHVVEDYGANWELISRLATTTLDYKVTTEWITGKDADLQWRTVIYGDTPEFENRFEVFEGDGDFIGTNARDKMIGDDGNDSFYGGAADDTLTGGNGNDFLSGGDDDDKLVGSRGEDTLDGGDGDDRLEGGADNDLLEGGDGADDMSGGTGADTLGGGDGADTLAGGSGNDLLEGGSGDDTLEGGADDDTLEGGAGQDMLDGGSGEDRLIATGDGDTLTGSGDADVFVFTAGPDRGSGLDVITDFDAGEDLIDLSAFASGSALSFFGVGAVSTLGAVYYTVAGDDLIVSLELDGVIGADFSFRLEQIASLASTDFILS